MPKILVVAYGGGHARLLVPVIRLLQERGHEVLVLGLTLGQSVFQEAGLSAVGLSEILQQSTRWQDIVQRGQNLVDESDVHPQIGLENSVAYLGSGFLDLIASHGESEAIKHYKKVGRKAFDPAITAREIIEICGCDVVVTTNSPRMERALVRAARSLQKHSVVVVDSFASIGRAWLSEPSYADCVCVFHESVKEALTSNGRPESDVIVTGNPVFDSLADVVLPERQTDKPHALYLSQNEARIDQDNHPVDPDALPSDVINCLLMGIQNDQLTAEVRFHPNQGERIRQEFNCLLDRSRSCSLEHTLVDADVVITASSTAGIQAQLLGLPLVKIGWSIRSGLVPFDQLGPTWEAQTNDQLLPKIQEAARADRFLKASTLGNATSAVVEQIERLACG
jgi:hypothetical protein